MTRSSQRNTLRRGLLLRGLNVRQGRAPEVTRPLPRFERTIQAKPGYRQWKNVAAAFHKTENEQVPLTLPQKSAESHHRDYVAMVLLSAPGSLF
jgi:hypothetical protein